MAEIFNLEEYRRRMADEKVLPSKKEDIPSSDDGVGKSSSEQSDRKLWFLLPAEVQDEMIVIQRSIANNGIRAHGQEFVEQQRLVAGWSDDEIVQFLSRPENLRTLQSKPFLATALMGRILGKV